MLILFGTRALKRRLGEGEFYCPSCQTDRSYVRFGYWRWFTLFFIPIFPMSGVRGDAVRCQTCNQAFQPAVLDLPQSGQFVTMLGDAFRQCALAVLKSGDLGAPAPRAVAVARIRSRTVDSSNFTDASLDADATSVDPSRVGEYVAPVAPRMTPEMVEEFVTGCAMIALADGPMSNNERSTLDTLAASLGLSQVHLAGIVLAANARLEAPRAAPSGELPNPQA
jgi:hypothetical protein